MRDGINYGNVGAYWGISGGYLLPHFFSIVAENDGIFLTVASCHKLFIAGCQIALFLGNKPMYKVNWEFIPPNLIVACCGRDFSNCCMLQPKMWQLLRVAAKFPFVARCRIPQYVPTFCPLGCPRKSFTQVTHITSEIDHDHAWLLVLCSCWVL